MVLQSPIPQFVGSRHLDGLFARLGLNQPAEQAAFESLWQQFERHTPLFGCADHPDVDTEQLDQVRQLTFEQLAGYARSGAIRAVEHHAVRTFLNAFRDSRGLTLAAAPEPEPEIAELIEPAIARLCEAAQCKYVPLPELFHYHRSLHRHYGVHREAFAELIDWCVAQLQHPDPPEPVRRFVAVMQRLELAERAATTREPERVYEWFGVELPADVRASPTALAQFAALHAPEQDAEPGSGHPLARSWHGMLRATTHAAKLDVISAEQVGAPRPLPDLLENALLVHVLGLEDRRRKAVLADAADRLLVHDFIPLAREVGAKQHRHEPVAGYLVAVVGAALRPWRFEAEPLTPEQRIVLVALLAELATGKSRKLLHQEKQHASNAALRTAINRALDRWPERIHAVSPKQRIDRVAAGFRYLNRVRRGSDPRVRDLAIVAELLGSDR
jgi:hypothetical protein